MDVTASQLRSDIYRLLDEVLASGKPLRIKRKGKVLLIVPDKPKSKLERIIPDPDYVNGDLDDFIHMDWYHEWNPDDTP
jgi:hypothetical protein